MTTAAEVRKMQQKKDCSLMDAKCFCEREESQIIYNFIKFPVYYDSFGQIIWDQDKNMVANIRGWGRLQYMEDGETIQDEIGKFITQAINEKWGWD